MRRFGRAIVVGAGPAGAACALALARSGRCEVRLLERAEMPRDKACGGGLSPRALALLGRLGLGDRVSEGALPIRGLRLVGPDGSEQHLDGGEMALVQRRDAFDMLLVEEALAAGARLETGVRVDRILRHRGEAAGVGADGTEVEGDVVVLAAGARGDGLSEDPRPRLRLDGVVARFEGVEATPGTVEMAFDPRIAPHYAWLFPEPGGTVNVGLCRAHDRRQAPVGELFAELSARWFPSLEGATRIGRLRGHPIVYSHAARFLVEGGLLRVGEAARLTDGFTGEGIWHALRSGLEAAAAIEAGRLRSYEWRCRLIFDPVLRSADVMARIAATRGFAWATRAAAAPWVQWLTSRLLAAHTSLGGGRSRPAITGRAGSIHSP